MYSRPLSSTCTIGAPPSHSAHVSYSPQVDDICDSGLTLKYLVDALKPRCASLTTVVLLNKTARRKVEITPDYVCFEVSVMMKRVSTDRGCQCPDRFVVGYGMDFDQRYRSLPFVGVLKQSVVECHLQNGRED